MPAAVACAARTHIETIFAGWIPVGAGADAGAAGASADAAGAGNGAGSSQHGVQVAETGSEDAGAQQQGKGADQQLYLAAFPGLQESLSELGKLSTRAAQLMAEELHAARRRHLPCSTPSATSFTLLLPNTARSRFARGLNPPRFPSESVRYPLASLSCRTKPRPSSRLPSTAQASPST